MATLDTYLSKPGSKTLTALSVDLGVSKGRLSQLRNSTDWPPDLALNVEASTDGGVDASELSPVVAKARSGGHSERMVA